MFILWSGIKVLKFISYLPIKRFCVLAVTEIADSGVRQFQFHFNLHSIEVEFIATALTIGLSPLVVSTAIYNAVQ